MLYGITGIPGHGKTLFTLDFVEKLKTNQVDEEGDNLPDRQVFYFGINELKLNWLPLEDPLKWFDLPDNCIVVIDEAQEHFPVRDAKVKVPVHCAKFEKHRHTGIDIVLVTQDVKFLDIHVRRLIGEHRHIERKFGTNTAVILFWEKTGNPEDYHSREKAEKTPWRYPKKYYKAYKSATQHNVKKKFPKILLLIPVILSLVFGAVYFLYSTLFGDNSKRHEVQQIESSGSLLPEFLNSKSSQSGKELSFVLNLKPEIPDIPQSAPFYRGLYKAKTYPKPQCIASGDSSRCTCYSQQGSKMQTSLRYCLTIVENGYFDPTINEKEQLKNNRRSERVSGGNKRTRSPSTPTETQYYPSGLNNKITF